MKGYYEVKKSNHTHFGLVQTLDFPAHFHSAMELVYIMEGGERITIDGKTDDLYAGSLAVAYPYQIHEYKNLAEGNKFYFILQPQNIGIAESEIASYIPKSPFYHYTGKTREYIEAILKPLILPFDDKPYGKQSVELHSYYRSLITALLQFHLEHVGTELVKRQPIEVELLRRIMTYLDTHFDDPGFDTYKAAQEIGISSQYLSSLIKKSTGCTLNEHLHNLRVAKARRLLRDSTMSISEIALESGFLSIRTFNRVFSEKSGMSPRDWRTTDHQNKLYY